MLLAQYGLGDMPETVGRLEVGQPVFSRAGRWTGDLGVVAPESRWVDLPALLFVAERRYEAAFLLVRLARTIPGDAYEGDGRDLLKREPF